MINILEILKKIPNLEDMVFYSPLYGDVRVKLNLEDQKFPILLYGNKRCLASLTTEGYFDTITIGKVESMLYPSRQNRDWSTFKISRKDLPRDTSVIVSETKIHWLLRKYAYHGKCYSIIDDIYSAPWKYIIPVDKFNFKDWTFKEEDNYGTSHKE